MVGQLNKTRAKLWILPSSVKSLLVLKPKGENFTRKLLNGTNIQITLTDASLLGATVGSEDFKEEYVINKYIHK